MAKLSTSIRRLGRTRLQLVQPRPYQSTDGHALRGVHDVSRGRSAGSLERFSPSREAFVLSPAGCCLWRHPEVFRGAPTVPHRASAARRTAGTQRRLPWGSFPLDGSSFDLLMRRFTSPAPLRSQGSSPSQRISRSLVALFHATSAYRIRSSGLFPSRQPHASRRRCSLAVEVSAGHPVPPSVEPPSARAPSLLSSDSPRRRFRLRSTSSPV